MKNVPEVADKLDDATSAFLGIFSNIFASISTLSIPDQRTAIKNMFVIPETQLEPVSKVEDKTIAGRHGPVAIRLLTPEGKGPFPVIVFFHRGGWVYGSIQESESICRRLANETGSIVAIVEYRLSPEHKFPVPLDDCYDATKWVVENAHSFSGDPQKITVCGESAGGNLAAAVALMATKKKQFKIAKQLLIYPILTNDLDKSHFEASPDKALLSLENMQFFWDMYLTNTEEGENEFASPLKSKNLSELPPAFIITADFDALKHEGKSYSEALHKQGVQVQLQNYAGVIHGFLDLPLNDHVKNEAIKDIAKWLK